jgi:hypothetical protein
MGESESVTIQLGPESLEALRKIGKSLGTASIQETLSRVIGSQAAIVEEVRKGNSAVIKDPSGQLFVTGSRIVPKGL